MSVSIPFTMVAGAKAKASEINACLQAIANKFTEGAGGITNADVSAAAGIYGTKLSNVPGTRIPFDRIEDDAVDKDKLKDDSAPGAPAAAVNNSNHIKDGIITSAKLVDNTIANVKLLDASVLSGKLKLVIYSQVIAGNLTTGSHTYDTGLLGANFQPLAIYADNAAVPGGEQQFFFNIYRNSLTDHYFIEAFNNSGGLVAIGTIYLVGISKT